MNVPHWRRRSSLAVAALLIALVGCGNGQTGSIGPVECSDDADCSVEWAERLTSPTSRPDTLLLGARCAAPLPGLLPRTACACDIATTELVPGAERADGTTAPDAATPVTLTLPAGAGRSYEGCSLMGRAGQCAYCVSEFAGCELDVPGEGDGCWAVCQTYLERLDQAAATTYDVEVLNNTCSSQGSCEQVVSIDGVCFTSGGNFDKAYDCELGVEAILCKAEPSRCSKSSATAAAASDTTAGTASEANVAGSDYEAHELRWLSHPACLYPEAACGASADCPSALSCTKAGRCDYCTASADCSQNETCRSGLCLLAAGDTCALCGADEDCIVDGAGLNEGRGNQGLRTLCMPTPTPPLCSQDGDAENCR